MEVQHVQKLGTLVAVISNPCLFQGRVSQKEESISDNRNIVGDTNKTRRTDPFLSRHL